LRKNTKKIYKAEIEKQTCRGAALINRAQRTVLETKKAGQILPHSPMRLLAAIAAGLSTGTSYAPSPAVERTGGVPPPRNAVSLLTLSLSLRFFHSLSLSPCYSVRSPESSERGLEPSSAVPGGCSFCTTPTHWLFGRWKQRMLGSGGGQVGSVRYVRFVLLLALIPYAVSLHTQPLL
jgi:hypothetical protein